MLKPNRELVRAGVFNKIRDLAFASIITEAFMNGLPFDHTELSDASEAALCEYSKAVCESIGGAKALESAIAVTAQGPKRTLLRDMLRICNESASTVAARVVQESKDFTNNSSMEELIADAGFTKKEYNKFSKDADNLDLDRIGEIIKNKVVEILKEEQANHERIDQMNIDLAEIVNKTNSDHDEAIQKQQPVPDEDDSLNMNDSDQDGVDDSVESDDGTNDLGTGNRPEDTAESDTDIASDDDEEDPFSDTSVKKASEGYLCLLNMKPEDLRHQSFFSTLQTAALESLLYKEDCESLDPDMINCDRLMNLTTQYSLPCMHKEKSAMEALAELASIKSADVQSKSNKHVNIAMEAAMVEATTVYTMLESLNTMNLIQVKPNDVRVAIESFSYMPMRIENDKKSANNFLRNLNKQITSESFTNYNLPTCVNKLNELETVSHMLHTCVESVDTSALKVIDARIDALNQKKAALESYTYTSKAETFEMRRKKNAGIAECNRIASMTNRVGPQAFEIVFEQSNDPNSFDVTIKRGNGNNVHSFITMESISGDMTKDLRDCIMESKLNDGKIPDIYMNKNDGTGARILIK